MSLQVIKDGNGKNTGIFIPMSDWDSITQIHEDLKKLVSIEPAAKKKLSDLAGSISKETANDMLGYVAESRKEWEERLKKQWE